MSMRSIFSLAVATAIGVGASSHAQQSNEGPTAPREERQQVSSPNETQQQDSSFNNRTTNTRQAVTQPNSPGATATRGAERTSGFRGQTTATSASQAVRLSELMDSDVHNHQDEELGEIEDVVVDTESGKIRYVALSVGGFLGVGDRMVAIPWTSFKHQKDEDGEPMLVLNIDRTRLENAPGFNEENWPDFGNERYNTEIDQYYGTGAQNGTTSPNATGRTSPATNGQSTTPGASNSSSQSPSQPATPGTQR